MDSVAGIFSTLEKPLKTGYTLTQFHAELSEAATKAQMIAIFFKYVSFQGGWSNCPPEVREKIKKAAGI